MIWLRWVTVGTIGLIACPGAWSHDHWIRMGDPDEHGKAEVRIESGHDFPGGEMQLPRRLLKAATLIDPEGKARDLELRSEEGCWKADVFLDRPGVWLARFALQRARDAAPIYTGTHLHVAGQVDDPSRYAVGEGLEIVPLDPVSGLQPGKTLRLELRDNGRAVDGRLTAISEKGRSVTLSTVPGRPAELRIGSAGAWLLTASHAGRGCSLTFVIAPLHAGETAP